MLPMSNDIRRRSGFTLVELLVVILILSILISIALPLYQSAVADAGKKAARTNMQIIATALTAWHVRNPGLAWPGNAADLATAISGDLPGGVNGPGNRSYTILAAGTTCFTPSVPTPVGTDGSIASQATIPNGEFAIASFDTTQGATTGNPSGGSGLPADDWCYIPGVSTQ